MNFGAIGGALGGVLGALGGGQKDKTSQTINQTQDVNLKNFEELVKGAGELERSGTQGANLAFRDLRGLLDLGPGASDVTGAQTDTNALLNALRGAAATGGAASQQDIMQSQALTQQLFAPQQQMMQQQFQDQEIANQRLSAQLGRPINDPVLRGRLQQEQMRQQANLGAQMTSFGAQQAQQFAQNRLGLLGQVAQVRQGLASQAFSNRQALATLGSQLTSQERNFRLAAAGRTTTGIQETISGGGFGGAMAGAIAGAGSLAGSFGKFGGGTGG